MSVEDIVREIKKLSTRKITQSTDLPVKILRENSNISGHYICDFCNDCVDKENFLSILNLET